MQFSMYYVDCATRNYRLWYNVQPMDDESILDEPTTHVPRARN